MHTLYTRSVANPSWTLLYTSASLIDNPLTHFSSHPHFTGHIRLMIVYGVIL